MSTGQICQARKKDGAPCPNYAVRGSNFCFNHDPARAAQRAQSRSAGGRARHGRDIGQAGADETMSLDSMADALRLIAKAVNDALRMERSLNRSKVLISAALAYGKLFEVSEMAGRIEALERRLDELQNQN